MPVTQEQATWFATAFAQLVDPAPAVVDKVDKTMSAAGPHTSDSRHRSDAQCYLGPAVRESIRRISVD